MTRKLSAKALNKLIEHEIRANKLKKPLKEAIQGRQPGSPLFEAPEDAIGLSSRARAEIRQIIADEIETTADPHDLDFVLDSMMESLNDAFIQGLEDLMMAEQDVEDESSEF